MGSSPERAGGSGNQVLLDLLMDSYAISTFLCCDQVNFGSNFQLHDNAFAIVPKNESEIRKIRMTH
jgi:hypothetical protein